MKPSSTHIPPTNLAPLIVNITASVNDVSIYSADSLLEGDAYFLTGEVKVPRGKPVSVYVDIYTSPIPLTEKPDSSTFQVLLTRAVTFNQGVSQLRVSLPLKSCHCVTYASPYLAAMTARVQSTTGLADVPSTSPLIPGLPAIPGVPATSGTSPTPEVPTTPGILVIPGLSGAPQVSAQPRPPWPITISVLQSEVVIDDSSIPSGLSIVAAYPQVPINTQDPNHWVWTNAADGYIIATDLGASANRDMHLFYAGLIFGIAGSAIIASVQAFFTARENVALKASDESIHAELSRKEASTQRLPGGRHDTPGPGTPGNEGTEGEIPPLPWTS